MLELLVTMEETYDEEKQEFVASKQYPLVLEHSLFSVSKWEEFHEKPFLGNDSKTAEETVWYIKAMSVGGEIPPEVFLKISNEIVESINEYITSKMTATWFAADPRVKNSKEIITAEVIYSWMITLNIPFECQHWHLNRLLTLIRVCNEKNSPPKKLSPRELAQRNRALNEKRLAEMQSSG